MGLWKWDLFVAMPSVFSVEHGNYKLPQAGLRDSSHQRAEETASSTVPMHQPAVTPKSSKLNESISDFHLKCHHSSNTTLKLNVAYTA